MASPCHGTRPHAGYVTKKKKKKKITEEFSKKFKDAE